MTEDYTWHVVVLITKSGGYFWGIGLVEILWKMVTVLLNQSLTKYIGFRDNLHGFRVGRGTGTASLKANMLQYMTAISEAVLHEILLDIQKACNSLDRDQCLEILAG